LHYEYEKVGYVGPGAMRALAGEYAGWYWWYRGEAAGGRRVL
jgi:hypothetical protein